MTQFNFPACALDQTSLWQEISIEREVKRRLIYVSHNCQSFVISGLISLFSYEQKTYNNIMKLFAPQDNELGT